MNPPKDSKTSQNEPRWLAFDASLLGIIAIACAIALLIVACNLKIDYYDSGGYLSNTRILAGEDISSIGLTYEFVRPLLLSFLSVPFAVLLSENLALASHLLPWAIAVLGGAFFYRYLKVNLSSTYATIGACILFLNPLYAHYATFFMADILSCLCTIIACHCLLQPRLQEWKYLTWATIAILVLLLARFNNLFIVFGLFLAAALSSEAVRFTSKTKYGGYNLGIARINISFKTCLRLCIPFVSAGLLTILTYMSVALLVVRPEEGTLSYLASNVAREMGPQIIFQLTAFSNPWHEDLSAIWSILNPAGTLLAVAGFCLCCYRRKRIDLQLILVVICYLALMNWIRPHREARYLFPILPALLYFQMIALQFGLQTKLKRNPLLIKVSAVALLGVSQALSVYQTKKELTLLKEPIYRHDWIAKTAEDISREFDAFPALYWQNLYHSLYPTTESWLAHDEFFRIHQFREKQVKLALKKPVLGIAQEASFNWQTLINEQKMTPNQINLPPSEDIRCISAFPVDSVIYLANPTFLSNALELPLECPPLTLLFIKRKSFELESYSGNRLSYRNSAKPSEQLTLDKVGLEWRAGKLGNKTNSWHFLAVGEQKNEFIPLSAQVEIPKRVEALAISYKLVKFPAKQ